MWYIEQIHKVYEYSWGIMYDHYGLILDKGSIPYKAVGSKLGVHYYFPCNSLCATDN